MKNKAAKNKSVKNYAVRMITASIAVFACCATTWAAEPKAKPENTILPAAAYRTPLNEVVVEGKVPYWQNESAPQWDKPKIDAPKIDDAAAGRLELAPRYTRDERDDYNQPREQLNPKPRTKLFELHF